MLGYKKVKKVPRVLNIKKNITVNFLPSDDGYYLRITAVLKDGFSTENEANLFLDKLKKYFFAFTVDVYYAGFGPDVPEAFEPLKQLKAIVYNGLLASSAPSGPFAAGLYTLDFTAMMGGAPLDSISFLPVEMATVNDGDTYKAFLNIKIPVSI